MFRKSADIGSVEVLPVFGHNNPTSILLSPYYMFKFESFLCLKNDRTEPEQK